MEKEKAYLELVKAQNNLKLAEIKKYEIAGSSSPLLDNNSNDGKTFQKMISYQRNMTQCKIMVGRSFCKDNLAKNSYQYHQIAADNKRSNQSFRDEAKSENNENKTSNNTIVIEHIDKLIDELLEGKEVSSSELDPTPALNIADALKKELESCHLPPADLLTLEGDSTKWPEFIKNFKTRNSNKVPFTNSMRMERLLSVLKGEAKKTVEGTGPNGIFYPTALKW